MRRALPFAGDSEELLSPTFVIPILALIEIYEHRILTNAKFNCSTFDRGAINAEKLGSVHLCSDDLAS
jgi:hypothetical protein